MSDGIDLSVLRIVTSSATNNAKLLELNRLTTRTVTVQDNIRRLTRTNCGLRCNETHHAISERFPIVIPCPLQIPAMQ
jgi:hypothetical protein